MKLLLDTHTLVWWFRWSPELTRLARDALNDLDNEIFVSVASAWEMAIKIGKGSKGGWPEAEVVLNDFERWMVEAGLTSRP